MTRFKNRGFKNKRSTPSPRELGEAGVYFQSGMVRSSHIMSAPSSDLKQFLKLQGDDIASMDSKTFETLIEAKRQMAGLSPAEQQRVMKEIARSERKKEAAGEALRKEKQRIQDLWMKIIRASGEKVSEVKIKRVEMSMFPDLRKAARENKVLFLTMPAELSLERSAEIARSWEKEFFTQAQVFLMQHDWAAAFDRAELNAPFRLPYEACAFEFQIGNCRMMALCLQHETEVRCSLADLTKEGWLIHDFSFPSDQVLQEDTTVNIYVGGKDEPMDFNPTEIMQYIMKQVRACCIALDAEVAVSEQQREPYVKQPNQRPMQTKPMGNYHVVSLVRRTRAPRFESEPTGRRVRMHFRRGHWRHFEDHKTWIKWMLVGDPDLGFIDKHYKL